MERLVLSGQMEYLYSLTIKIENLTRKALIFAPKFCGRAGSSGSGHSPPVAFDGRSVAFQANIYRKAAYIAMWIGRSDGGAFRLDFCWLNRKIALALPTN